MKKVIVSVVIFVLFGCASPPSLPKDEAKQLEEEIRSLMYKQPGFFYTVKRGDTLWSIAQQYNIELDLLINKNQDVLKGSRVIKVGMRLFIPGRSAGLAEANFVWPLKGPLIGVAGVNGINIRAFEGQSVRATKSGVVTFVSDHLRGYGKTVVIKHPDGFVSLYAYNSEINVKKGEPVKQGQVIARAGKTGRADKPQLHFRLHKNGQPVNPMHYLSR